MNGTNMENSDIILVTGYAGSGKSTYCEMLEKEQGYFYLSHDKWMHKQLERNLFDPPEGYDFLINLLGEKICVDPNNGNLNIDRKKLGGIILNDPNLNQIVINYCTSIFVLEIIEVIEYHRKAVIEIPFLNHSISWIKSKYPFVKIYYKNENEWVAKNRLRDRGWDEKRIDYTLNLFDKMAYGHDINIDKYV